MRHVDQRNKTLSTFIHTYLLRHTPNTHKHIYTKIITNTNTKTKYRNKDPFFRNYNIYKIPIIP